MAGAGPLGRVCGTDLTVFFMKGVLVAVGYLPLFYFSGTGNTWWVAGRLAEALDAQGFHAEPLSIEQVSPSRAAEALDRARVVGVGYPVYGSDAPLILQDFLRHLPATNQPKPVLVFVTQGVWSGDGAYCMRSLIEDKGYRVRWAVHFLMPGNLSLDLGPLLNLFFRSMKAKPEDALGRVNRLATRVAQDEPWIMGRHLLLSGGWMQRIPYRKTMSYWQSGHLKVDPERCTLCGRCIRLCPVGNITLLEDLPRFGDACNLCLRCFNFCPQMAVLAFGRPFNPTVYGDAPYRGPTSDFRPEHIIGG